MSARTKSLLINLAVAILAAASAVLLHPETGCAPEEPDSPPEAGADSTGGQPPAADSSGSASSS